MPTLFERIFARELPAEELYRDADIIAIRDIHPRARTHVLIIPRKPIPSNDAVADEDAALIGRMFLVARDVARREGIAQSGYRLIFNCREHGGQEVPHLHLHLVGGEPLGPMVTRR